MKESLDIEIYEFLNGLHSSFLNNVFYKNISNSYDLRNHKKFIPEILKKLPMEIKLFHIWHLKSEANF